MPKPSRCRWVGRLGDACCFKPHGISLAGLDEVAVTAGEFEEVRLADLVGLCREQAAERKKVSRQTFGRITESGHRKVAEALVEGKALWIEGGNFEVKKMRTSECGDCAHSWQEPFGTGRLAECPACHGSDVYRADADGGRGAGRCRRGGADL